MTIRKFFVYLLIFMIFMNSNTTSIHAKSLNMSDKPVLAKVLEVIDGEALKVITIVSKTNPKPEIKLVRMIGITTNGSKTTLNITRSQLLGQIVYLVTDSHSNSFPALSFGWSYAYVYKDISKSFQEILLENGWATIDYKFAAANQLNDFEAAVSYAKNHNNGQYINNEILNTSKINLNTASAAQLAQYLLDDEHKALATAIVNYRSFNSFNSIDELKLVNPYFSGQWFNDNQTKLSVMTHLITALDIEMQSLFPNSIYKSNIANDWLNYRTFNPVKSTIDLATLSGVDFLLFNSISKYITLDYNLNTYIESQNTININTASAKEIQTTLGVSEYMAESIVKYRNKYTYTYNSVQEMKNDYELFFQMDTNRLYQSAVAFTNLNTASTNELTSLFGSTSFDKNKKASIVASIIKSRPIETPSDLIKILGTEFNIIKPFVYTKNNALPQSININLYNREKVAQTLGLDSTDKSRYMSVSSYYKSRALVNFDAAKYGVPISLYMNMNTASYDEMIQIDGISPGTVNNIIELRNKQFLGDAEDIRSIFELNKQIDLFTRMKDYFVFY